VRGPRDLRDLRDPPYLLDEPDVDPVLLAVEEERGEVLGGLGHDAVLAGGGGEEGDVVGARGLGRGGGRGLGPGSEERSRRLLRDGGGGGRGGGGERRVNAREDVLRETGRGQLDLRGRLGLRRGLVREDHRVVPRWRQGGRFVVRLGRRRGP